MGDTEMEHTITPSIVGFKVPQADLHRQSPKIFTASIIISVILVGICIHVPFSQEVIQPEKREKSPVIIQLQNIPETRHIVRAPAPKLSMPLEILDTIIPDNITIESTVLELEEVTIAPPMMATSEIGAVAEEEEIFELFSVEEPPKRLNAVAPEFPEMANRAGIKGVVLLKVLVSKTGVVDSVVVMSGPEVFHKISIEAAMKTTFTPAKQNDRPVACWVNMPFRFTIEE